MSELNEKIHFRDLQRDNRNLILTKGEQDKRTRFEGGVEAQEEALWKGDEY